MKLFVSGPYSQNFPIRYVALTASYPLTDTQVTSGDLLRSGRAVVTAVPWASYVTGLIPSSYDESSSRIYEKLECSRSISTDKHEYRDLAHKI